RELLMSPRTSFVVVSSPQPDAVSEAGEFVRRLTAASLTVGAVVVNRATPRLTDRAASSLIELAGALAEPSGTAEGPGVAEAPTDGSAGIATPSELRQGV